MVPGRPSSCPIALVLVPYSSRPGRSGLSLHLTGMIAMLHRWQGRNPHGERCLSSRLRLRPENATYPPLRPFTCSPPVLTPKHPPEYDLR